MTNHLLYSYSLCVALPLMLFFSLYFFFAKVPAKSIFGNYLKSRRTMGCAVLLLAANYSVHFFFEVRFFNVNLAILMNLSTYFLCYWLFSSALTTLLDRFYISRRRLRTHLSMWLLFSACSCVVLLGMPDSLSQKIGLFVLAAWLVAYGLFLSFRLLRTYRKAVRLFDDTHSDDYGAYIRWLSIFTYWAVGFGVACALLTFLPDRWVYVWILSSVPFYIYLYCCYQNYLLFYEQVEEVIEDGMDAEQMPTENEPHSPSAASQEESYYDEIAAGIEKWTEAEGYLRPRITIKDLADVLHTNRTYLSRYINTVYGMTYREWITGLRMEYAKQRMLRFPEQKMAEVSEACGFLSLSHFMKAFKEREDCSPSRWKKMKLQSDAEQSMISSQQA